MKLVNDNHMYAKVAKLIKNRKELTDDKLAELEEIVMDDAKVKAIVDASKSSMGIYNILLPFFLATYDNYHLLVQESKTRIFDFYIFQERQKNE